MEEIEQLVRRFINCQVGLLWKANQLLQHIEQTWTLVSRGPRDPTNNTTDGIIRFGVQDSGEDDARVQELGEGSEPCISLAASARYGGDLQSAYGHLRSTDSRDIHIVKFFHNPWADYGLYIVSRLAYRTFLFLMKVIKTF